MDSAIKGAGHATFVAGTARVAKKRGERNKKKPAAGRGRAARKDKGVGRGPVAPAGLGGFSSLR